LLELSSLILSENDFTGTLPTEIGVLNSLTHLSLAGNGFTGTFPSDIVVLKGLTHLSLGNILKVKLNHDINKQDINLQFLLVLTLCYLLVFNLHD